MKKIIVGCLIAFGLVIGAGASEMNVTDNYFYYAGVEDCVNITTFNGMSTVTDKETIEVLSSIGLKKTKEKCLTLAKSKKFKIRSHAKLNPEIMAIDNEIFSFAYVQGRNQCMNTERFNIKDRFAFKFNSALKDFVSVKNYGKSLVVLTNSTGGVFVFAKTIEACEVYKNALSE